MATDNSDTVGKVMIRQWLLDQLGGAVNCNVLELYAGMGHMYDACYTKAKKHMAFEIRKVDRPGWLQGDNRTLLKTRAKGWDFYDVDAYANPWMLCSDIARLREPGKFGMAITCGITRSLNTGLLNPFVRQRIGMYGFAYNNGLITRWYPEIINWLMLDWARYGVKVLEAKHIRSIHSHKVHYYSVVVEKS